MNTKTTIRGIDPELYKQAKSSAARLGITMGILFNTLIRDYIKRTSNKP